jgi:hypothetical protein
MKHIVETGAADGINDTGPDMRTYGCLISCNSENQLVSLDI